MQRVGMHIDLHDVGEVIKSEGRLEIREEVMLEVWEEVTLPAVRKYTQP